MYQNHHSRTTRCVELINVQTFFSVGIHTNIQFQIPVFNKWVNCALLAIIDINKMCSVRDNDIYVIRQAFHVRHIFNKYM